MPWKELAISIGDGQPGSPDWDHGLAVLQARIGLHMAEAAEISADAARALRERLLSRTADLLPQHSLLVSETRRLRIATWVMAVGTVLVAIAALVGLNAT